MTPYRCTAPYDWGAIFALLWAEFAYMDGVVDPPSSLTRLTEAEIAGQAERGEVWAIGLPPVACVFFTYKADALYIGKLAVSAQHRRKGLASALMAVAEARAHALGLAALELQTRVELVENHLTYLAMGFVETGRSAHPGYDRPTSVTYRKRLAKEP
ncbi:GNAT family N-acetyltransferase [Neotabrizicola sp. sgz301269]|uniref:GNAT family N-acetyltransferase n=1 Tax=Neotabrizicola sp. sgz301269 TaxID=3276282 RepID=UPI00376FBDBE